MKETVGVITLNYNQNDYTIKCINSLLRSTHKNIIILLIDNGSKEENFLRLKKNLSKDSRIVLKRVVQNCGYVGGINYGFKEGIELNPDYFLIMNNDTLIDEKAITELLIACKDYDNQAIVTGKVYNYDERNRLQDIGYTFSNKKTLSINRVGLNEFDHGQYDSLQERDLLDDVYWLLPADLYKKIGGYNTYFWFNAEQADFALRAKKEGYKLIYTPNAKLWHKGSVSIAGREKNPRLVYWHIQSTLIFRYIHLPKLFFFIEYCKVISSIISSHLKLLYQLITKKAFDFKYPLAKLQGLFYFNKWLFIRNKNNGYNPFND